MSIIEHIFLFCLLFAVFFVWGGNFAKLKEAKWFVGLIPILLYSFVLGSRYGWGPDYIFYKYQYEHAFSYLDEQLGFRVVNQALNSLGFSFVGGFFFYSFTFMLCAFILLSSFGKSAKFMYWFLLPAVVIFVNSAIRQGFALSFLLLALYFFYKQRYVVIILLLGISAVIHSAVLITAIMIAAIYILFKRPFYWKVTIPIYFLVTFVVNSKTIDLSVISNLLSTYVALDSKFQSYVDNSDTWFSNDAANSIYEQSLGALLLSSLFYVSFIYLGYYALRATNNRKIIFLYNSVVFGIIFYRMFFLLEILRRLAEPLVMLYFVPLGFTVYFFQQYNKNKPRLALKYPHIQQELKTVSYLFPYCLVAISIYLVLFWGRFIFLNPGGLFFWNQ